MSIFIDIPYEELKKAIVEIEKKKGVCDILPHGRFRFDFVENLGQVQRVEECDGQKIKFDLIVCEALGGKSTGTSANQCRNCIIRKCKHEHTKKEKCEAYPNNCDKEFHNKCLDCGALVDLQIEREKSFKAMEKTMEKLKDSNIFKMGSEKKEMAK